MKVIFASVLTAVSGSRVYKHNATSGRSQCGVLGASSQEASISIVNGENAPECKWKWQVGLTTAGRSGMPWCGGMLIEDKWVLTAAHCMEGETPSRVVVRAGDWRPKEASSNRQELTVEKIVMHPEYDDSDINNDYALIKLADSATLNECVGTVCLPEEGQDATPEHTCWITGWGTLSSFAGQPDVLQEGQVTTLPLEACRGTGYAPEEITDRMLCAQGRSTNGGIIDACQGDSGGPLVCQRNGGAWKVYGATSWGYGCAGAKFPGIWARVHEVLDWIDDTMHENQAN